MAAPPEDALVRLSNPRIFPDGRIGFTAERQDGNSGTVSCQIHEVGDIVSFLTILAKDASERLGLGDGPPKMPYLTYIPATGIGFAPSKVPEQTALVLNMSGFALAFSIPNSDLVRLGDEFRQVAQTLSVTPGRKN